ncbi:MAG: septation protein SpoVG family protein [Pirellulaceae bacterium]
MEITEVRIKLMENSEDRLRAFCSITFDDCFVIRDLKIIEGNSGPFVAMPSRKLTAHCRQCNAKNHLRARFCNQCGKRMGGDKYTFDDQGRAKLYADIAHPINAESREQIQSRVIGEFYEELERAKQPGYVSRYDEEYGESSPRRHDSRADQSHNAPRTPHEKSSHHPSQMDTGAGGEAGDEPASGSDETDFGRGIF